MKWRDLRSFVCLASSSTSFVDDIPTKRQTNVHRYSDCTRLDMAGCRSPSEPFTPTMQPNQSCLTKDKQPKGRGEEEPWARSHLESEKRHEIHRTAHFNNDEERHRGKENDDPKIGGAITGSAGTANLLIGGEDDDGCPTPTTWLGCSESMYVQSDNAVGAPSKNGRGPLKKRLSPHPRSQVSTPFPPAPKLLRTTSSSFYGLMGGTTTPLLRQSSSSSNFSLYMHHYSIPPPLRLTTSLGQKLMEAPLLETPQAIPMNGERNLVSTGHPPRAHRPDMITTPALLPTDNGPTNQRCALVSRYSYTPNFFSFHRGTPTGKSGLLQGSKRVANSNIWMPQTTSRRVVVTDRRSMGPLRSPVALPSRHPNELLPDQTRSMDPSPGRGDVKKETIEIKPKQRIRVQNPLETQRELFENVPMTTRPCKCGSTQCLKLYCECFRNGSYCDKNLCYCTQCFNTEKHNSIPEPRGPRVTAILGILARRPRAFESDQRMGGSAGCRCKKSG
jgi:hypothetical protein